MACEAQILILERQKVVVTGAAGFIGSHLVRRLAACGATVTGIDNERSGLWSRVPVDLCRAVHADFAHCSDAELAEALAGADVLFHLAAEKYNSSKSSPQKVIDVNISGTQRLFEAALAAGVRQTVFTSSLYAYGSLGPEDMKESDVLRPITTYGMSKVAGEDILRSLRFRYGFSSAVARLFFVYGPGQFAEGGYKSVIVSNFERLARGGSPIVFGDGRQELDYVYVDDVVRALIMLADPDTDGTTVNIGSGRGYSINEVTEAMLLVAGAQVRPEFGDPDWTHGSRRVGSRDLAEQSLAWVPDIDFETGLRAVWDGYNV